MTSPKAIRKVVAFAPASIANLSVGFDILGLGFPALGDEITLTRSEKSEVIIDEIEWENPVLQTELPLDAKKNTAGGSLLAFIEDQRLSFGFRVKIRKGIPVGSGLGGSAADAVGAVVAANTFLERPLTTDQLLRYALEGESISSGGAKHADNVAACLFGGLILVQPSTPFEYVRIPFPSNVHLAVVHPHVQIHTRQARELLKKEVPMRDFAQQTANLGCFVAACFQKDLGLLQRSFRDCVIEPQRSALIPGFARARAAAEDAGAMGFAISGSGPTVLALAESRTKSDLIISAILGAFRAEGVATNHWVCGFDAAGARIKDFD